MKDLEQYIKENREAFDQGELPQGNRERFLRKLEMSQNSVATETPIGILPRKVSRIKYITASAASIAAVLLIALFVNYRDGNVNHFDIKDDIYMEEYINLINELDKEIIELHNKGNKKAAKEATKASKSVQKETIPLEEQLPEELSERERAKILREYYKEKTEGLKRIQSFLAVQTLEEK